MFAGTCKQQKEEADYDFPDFPKNIGKKLNILNTKINALHNAFYSLYITVFAYCLYKEFFSV